MVATRNRGWENGTDVVKLNSKKNPRGITYSRDNLDNNIVLYSSNLLRNQNLIIQLLKRNDNYVMWRGAKYHYNGNHIRYINTTN